MSYNDQKMYYKPRGQAAGRGRYFFGPFASTDATLDLPGPALLNWNGFTGNTPGGDTTRVTADLSLGGFTEDTAFWPIGPYHYIQRAGRYVFRGVGGPNSTGYNGNFFGLRAGIWDSPPWSFIAGLLRKRVPHFAFPTVQQTGNGELGGGTAYAGRNFAFNLLADIVSVLGTGNYDVTFGLNPGGAILGHPVAAGQTLIVPRGQVALGALEGFIRAGIPTASYTTGYH